MNTEPATDTLSIDARIQLVGAEFTQAFRETVQTALERRGENLSEEFKEPDHGRRTYESQTVTLAEAVVRPVHVYFEKVPGSDTALKMHFVGDLRGVLSLPTLQAVLDEYGDERDCTINDVHSNGQMLSATIDCPRSISAPASQDVTLIHAENILDQYLRAIHRSLPPVNVVAEVTHEQALGPELTASR